MKVALVHDDLMQWGGAERVLLAITELYPETSIYTSVFNKDNQILVRNFQNKKIVTSFLQKIPLFKSLYKILLPLYPIAFEQFDFSEYDLVISSTTRFAKSIITKPETIHVCYCHTPPRFLWNFSREKTAKFFSIYLSFLRIFDQVSSYRVDHFIAGSDNAAKRINKIYKRESKVCKPFVDDKFFASDGAFDGDYFLIISRLNKYKKIDIAIKSFDNFFKNETTKLKIVGDGPELKKLKQIASNKIDFYKAISDEAVISLLQGAKALIVVGEEDFGLTALEAQACGKPVIAYGKGGVLETVEDGVTGIFFKDQKEESIKEAFGKFITIKFNSSNCINNAEKSRKHFFIEKFTNQIQKITQNKLT